MSKPKDPCHVHPNPYKPEVCPVLSFGLYFAYKDITIQKDPKIFNGPNEKKRFEKLLREYLKDSSEEIPVGEYGTHSIRKGSGTYVSSGTTCSPPHAAIAYRGGWPLAIRDIYLKYEAAGDQYVGRVLCGLNVNDESFAVLPPTFKPEYEHVVQRILHDCFKRYDEMTNDFKQVLRMTMASVVYHKDTLLKIYI